MINSDYEHIGMILKLLNDNGGYDIWIVEAVSNYGVVLRSWELLVNK